MENSRFEHSLNFHPFLLISPPVLATGPSQECYTLQLWQPLGRSFFVDPFQLADPSQPFNQKMKERIVVEGEQDLELPEYLVPLQKGRGLLFNLSPRVCELRIPLHVRYQNPQWNRLYTKQVLPQPIIFWNCAQKCVLIKDKTLRRDLSLMVPTGNLNDQAIVLWGTWLAVVLASIILLIKLM